MSAKLTTAQERQLAAAIAAGDQDARRQMIEANVGLVGKIAGHFLHRGLSFEDLFGEGTIGLITAVDRFDPENHDVHFATYAAHWIRQAIRDALVNRTDMIRLPAYAFRILSKWRQVERKFCASGRDLDFDEIASALGLSSEQRECIRLALQTRAVGKLDFPAIAPRLLPDVTDWVETADEVEFIKSRLACLSSREQLIVTMRFGLDGNEPATLREVGERLGVTREWVRKIESSAIVKLKELAA